MQCQPLIIETKQNSYDPDMSDCCFLKKAFSFISGWIIRSGGTIELQLLLRKSPNCYTYLHLRKWYCLATILHFVCHNDSKCMQICFLFYHFNIKNAFKLFNFFWCYAFFVTMPWQYFIPDVCNMLSGKEHDNITCRKFWHCL